MQKYTIMFIFLCISINGIAQISDSLKIFFSFDKSQLSDTSKHKIDHFFRTNGTDVLIKITAFADYVGSKSYNYQLSKQRAQSVADYLKIELQIANEQIETTAGGELDSGERPKTGNGLQKHRFANLHISRLCTDTIPPKTIEDFDYETTEIGEQLVLKGLNFYGGRHTLLPEAVPVLRNLLRIMQEYPTLQIEIHGHICCGTPGEPDGYDHDANNNTLSVNRAEFVFKYLFANGIDPKRMSFRGFGYTRPLVKPEITEEEKTRNRRVEIKITGK